MDEAELSAQLRALLAEELSDRIPELERTLLALAREPGDDALRLELRRLVHAVKGASRSAGVLEIESASHELESVLAETAEGEPLPPETIARGTALVDQLERARQGLAGTPTPAVEEPAANVRVAVDELDDLLEQSAAVILGRQSLVEPTRELAEITAELGATRALSTAGLVQLTRRLSTIQRRLAGGLSSMGSTATALDIQVRRLRLRSVAEACRGCERIAHDIADSLGKQVELQVRGGETKIDRAQVEPLREVLIQLVRNAIVHGIEMPEVRQAAGKPERGTVTIAGELDGDMVRVTVTDDGAGLDRAAIAVQMQRRGGAPLSDADLERAIFSPGMTTARTVTENAGRGVGLDIVKQRIEALHGSVGLTSAPGHTQFSIAIPTTIATVAAVLVTVNGVTYAVPTSAVERLVRVDLQAVRTTDRGAVARIDDDWLPVAHLEAILGEARPFTERRLPGLVVRRGRARGVILVSRVETTAELLVGPLPSRVGALRHIAGQASMGSGSIVLVLNVADVLEDVDVAPAMELRGREAEAKRRVLVADDSATTRALMVNILRTAGFDVTSAVDGEAALSILRGDDPFDVMVSDVDMPNRDGFSLTAEARRLSARARMPIILVTARGTEADRKRGLEAGASAYLVKSGFDQTTLLQTIARLL